MKAVIFDLGGVLIDLDMHRCFENIRALGVDLDAISKASDDSEKGATICEGITASGMMHLYQVGKVSTGDFIGLMLRLSREGTSYQQLLDAWNSCLLTIPDFKLEFIKELRQTGIPAEECLFLDDSKANCEAAERLGINCINVPVRSDYREAVKARLLQQ